MLNEILIPAKLTVAGLAYSLGEYPTVIQKIIEGEWPMLPRVAQRLEEMKPHLIKKGAKWGPFTTSPIPENLLGDKILTEKAVIYKGQLLWDVLANYSGFTEEGLRATYPLSNHLFEHILNDAVFAGYVRQRELLNDELVWVYRWNPKRYVMRPGREPTLNCPAEDSPAPSYAKEIKPRKKRSSEMTFAVVDKQYEEPVREWLRERSMFEFSELVDHLGYGGQKHHMTISKCIRVLLRDLGWEDFKQDSNETKKVMRDGFLVTRRVKETIWKKKR